MILSMILDRMTKGSWRDWRYEVGVATDSVLKLLQEGDVTGISRTETLFIL